MNEGRKEVRYMHAFFPVTDRQMREPEPDHCGFHCEIEMRMSLPSFLPFFLSFIFFLYLCFWLMRSYFYMFMHLCSLMRLPFLSYRRDPHHRTSGSVRDPEKPYSRPYVSPSPYLRLGMWQWTDPGTSTGTPPLREPTPFVPTPMPVSSGFVGRPTSGRTDCEASLSSLRSSCAS